MQRAWAPPDPLPQQMLVEVGARKWNGSETRKSYAKFSIGPLRKMLTTLDPAVRMPA